LEEYEEGVERDNDEELKHVDFTEYHLTKKELKRLAECLKINHTLTSLTLGKKSMLRLNFSKYSSWCSL